MSLSGEGAPEMGRHHRKGPASHYPLPLPLRQQWGHLEEGLACFRTLHSHTPPPMWLLSVGHLEKAGRNFPHKDTEHQTGTCQFPNAWEIPGHIHLSPAALQDKGEETTTAPLLPKHLSFFICYIFTPSFPWGDTPTQDKTVKLM